MQKFIFSKIVYAKTMRDADTELGMMLAEAVEDNDPLRPFTVTQIAQRPPFDKPGTIYYTVRAGRKGPRIGAVTLLRMNGSWHRGIVICAPLDNFDREYARRESYRRAMMAAKRGKSMLQIGRHQGFSGPEEALCPTVGCFLAAAATLPGNQMDGEFQCKAEFSCKLTPYEQHLVSKRWPDGVVS